ncbi:hypothetical protein BBG47_18795 [Paenibacillus sp. KS1]|uniref:P-loop NTPase fold protein n=1 Tax=Paenibacillus sp. KS1 TaxID=1849249 RepID=UPI00080659AC|nr:P-loop NTPase fold protein [Paenibacillus sp. KS1]OBY77992.1 hypothetical protein BBG47_18795 [Paenibacillus sp. KS1]
MLEEFNNGLTDFSLQALEVVRCFIELCYNYVFNLVKSFNTIIVLCFIIVGLIYWYKVRKNRKLKLKFVNVLAHISITCLFGYLIEISNIKKINDLLIMYWSIGWILYLFFSIVFIKELMIYLKSTKKITKNFSKVYYFLGLTYIFTAISTNQLFFVDDLLLIGVFIFGWFILQLLTREINTGDIDKVNEESDVEINVYEQLLPTRKHEYSNLYGLLRGNNYNEPFALVLNGDWGTGKTSLINVLSQKLSEDGNHMIFIQPMILDTTEKLMEYFFGQLEDILNSNGIFTGKDSPFKKYVNIIFQTINTLNLKQVIKLDVLLENLDNEERNDFRNSKKWLEKDIYKLLSNGMKKNKRKKDGGKGGHKGGTIDFPEEKSKIYIIVDDFDRVEEETFNSTLIFIKEVVNFRGINVIFLMDEQRIDGNERINRAYLDKFVSKKFQLSKLSYQEIFSYFINNVDERKLIDEWTHEIRDNIKKNAVLYITDVIKDINNLVTRIQEEIDSLSKNTKKSQNNNDPQVPTQLEKLNHSKMEVEGYLQKLNDGISNVRKVKKIIREIKELLVTIDLRVSEHKNVKVNLSRIDQIYEIIVRVAILKILFGEHVDKLIQQDNDFFDIMQNNKYIKNKNYITIPFFSMFFRMGISEEQGLKQEILNDFCNAVVLNRPFNRLFADKKTDSEKILSDLDDPNHSLTINSIEEIREYLRVIMYYNYEISSNSVNSRRNKLIDHIITLFEKESLTLKNLFEILSDSRNSLLETDIYFAKLYEILNGNNQFQSTNDKDVCFAYLNGTTMHIFRRYQSDILMIMNLLKLKDPAYTYESISSDLSDIFELKDMVKAIRRIFNEENLSTSELDFFKQWVNKSIQSIKNENKDNEYIIESIKQYQNRIHEFIKIYQLKEEISEKLRSISVEPTHKFTEKLSIKSKEELICDIQEFHKYIYTQKNKMTWSYLRYFGSLLMFTEEYTRNNELEDDIINITIELYNSIPKDEYDENSDEKRTWLWCTVKLGVITENQKQRKEANEGNDLEVIMEEV